jgi:serine/threonine protein kinase
MLTLRYPFQKESKELMMKAICNENNYFPTSLEIEEVLILKQMLSKNPDQRSNVKDLISYVESVLKKQ